MKQTARQKSLQLKAIRKWHLWVLWPALFCTAIYLLSALAHPLMTWTGPQAQTRLPPSFETDASHVHGITEIIKTNRLQHAIIAKLVPYKNEVLFQVTESLEQPRRYFSLTTQQERPNHDRQQAVWLALHYTGLNENKTSINHIELKTQFDHEYPWVNRLLPVYKINFDTEDRLTVFIHTETQALAGITNDWKRVLVFIFQNFHSFTWLDHWEPFRVALVMTMMVIMLVMAITGLLFLTRLKHKQAPSDGRRRWHRRLAWVAVVPMLMFIASGMYHLVQMSLVPAEAGLRLSQQLNLQDWVPPEQVRPGMNQIENTQSVNQISLVHEQSNIKSPMFRLSLASSAYSKTPDRREHFKGISQESGAQYLDAFSGKNLGNLDAQLITQQAQQVLNATELDMELITHFGPSYDFRNKRLPVWQMTAATGERIFIDPITHILVDRNSPLTRTEGYSFSFLHKWNMFVPILGRFKRDILIVGILAVSFLLLLMGILMHLKRQKNAAKSAIPLN